MRLLIDGVPLDDPDRRWFLDYSALLPASAARDVAKLRLTRRDGNVTRRLSWGEGSLKVVVNVPPPRAFGSLPIAPVEERVRQLLSLLSRAESVVMETDNGPTRSVGVVEAAVSDPSRLSPTAWRIDATLTLDPFWREGALVTSAPVPVPGEVVFPEWAGTTGDVQDGILRVQGPLTEFSAVAVDGTGVSFAHSVSAAQYVFVDVARFRGWRGGASSWSPNNTPVLLDYPPGGPLRLSPGVNGISLSVAAVGVDSTSKMWLRASKWWL